MFSLQAVASKFLWPSLVPRPQKRFVFNRPMKQKKPAWMPRAVTEHRPPQICAISPYKHPDPKPCFDISSVLVETGNPCHEKIIRSFLFTHYWPREPSTVSMYVPLCSPYLAALTERYATSGDRWLAFEHQPRTKERRAVGVLVADKIYPWAADEYEDWGDSCCLRPERYSMYFRCHCIRSPNIFEMFNVPYTYNVEVLATSSDVTGQGIAVLLMRTAILNAMAHRYPLIQIISKSTYTHTVCERVGMKRLWEMDYNEFIDQWGKCVFFPRRPHKTVALYARRFTSKDGLVPESWKEPELYAVYKKLSLDKKTIPYREKRCNPEFPLFPKCQTC